MAKGGVMLFLLTFGNTNGAKTLHRFPVAFTISVFFLPIISVNFFIKKPL